MRRRNVSREEHDEMLRRREAKRIVEERFAMAWDDAWYDFAMTDIGGSLAACAVEVCGDPIPKFIEAYQKYAFGAELRDHLDIKGVTTTEIAMIQSVLVSAEGDIAEALSARAGVPLQISRKILSDNPERCHKELAKIIVAAHVDKMSSNSGADFARAIIERSLISTRNEDEQVWESWFLAELRDNFGSSDNVGRAAFRDNASSAERIDDTVNDALKEVMADLEGPDAGMDGP